MSRWPRQKLAVKWYLSARVATNIFRKTSLSRKLFSTPTSHSVPASPPPSIDRRATMKDFMEDDATSDYMIGTFCTELEDEPRQEAASLSLVFLPVLIIRNWLSNLVSLFVLQA